MNNIKAWDLSAEEFDGLTGPVGFELTFANGRTVQVTRQSDDTDLVDVIMWTQGLSTLEELGVGVTPDALVEILAKARMWVHTTGDKI